MSQANNPDIPDPPQFWSYGIQERVNGYWALWSERKKASDREVALDLAIKDAVNRLPELDGGLYRIVVWSGIRDSEGEMDWEVYDSQEFNVAKGITWGVLK